MHDCKHLSIDEGWGRGATLGSDYGCFVFLVVGSNVLVGLNGEETTWAVPRSYKREFLESITAWHVCQPGIEGDVEIPIEIGSGRSPGNPSW